MLKDLLQKVASALDKLAVPYAVIGGLAVITRGVVRATKDVDFLVDWPVRQAEALAQSLTANGLPATFHRGDADDPLPGVIRIIIAYPAGPIRCDILFPSRAWQAETVRKAARVEVEGLAVPVVQAADLFLLKLHAGGTMDLFDAARLLELQTEDERRVWEKRATEIHRSRAYARCLKFLREGL